MAGRTLGARTAPRTVRVLTGFARLARLAADHRADLPGRAQPADGIRPHPGAGLLIKDEVVEALPLRTWLAGEAAVGR
eukprot:scaffold50895_cov38-Prasinocladus_malaysianus.AAC.1